MFLKYFCLHYCVSETFLKTFLKCLALSGNRCDTSYHIVFSFELFAFQRNLFQLNKKAFVRILMSNYYFVIILKQFCKRTSISFSTKKSFRMHQLEMAPVLNLYLVLEILPRIIFSKQVWIRFLVVLPITTPSAVI